MAVTHNLMWALSRRALKPHLTSLASLTSHAASADHQNNAVQPDQQKKTYKPDEAIHISAAERWIASLRSQ